MKKGVFKKLLTDPGRIMLQGLEMPKTAVTDTAAFGIDENISSEDMDF